MCIFRKQLIVVTILNFFPVWNRRFHREGLLHQVISAQLLLLCNNLIFFQASKEAGCQQSDDTDDCTGRD